MGGTMTLSGLIFLVINCLLGTGVFIAPGLIASDVGIISVPLILIWGGFFTVLCTCYSRLIDIMGDEFDPMAYCSAAFGSEKSQIYGWVLWWGLVFNCAVVWRSFEVCLGYLFDPVGSRVLGTLLSFLYIYVLCHQRNANVLKSGKFLILFTRLRCVPISMVAFVGFALATNIYQVDRTVSFSVAGLSNAILMLVFLFQGFELILIFLMGQCGVILMLPQVLYLAVWIVTSILCAVQMGVFLSNSVGSSQPLASQASYMWGEMAGKILTGVAILSALAYLFAIQVASRKLFPRLIEWAPVSFAKFRRELLESKDISAPLLTLLFGLSISQIFSIRDLIGLSVLFACFHYIVCALSLIVLSRAVYKNVDITAIGTLAVVGLFLFGIPLTGWVFILIVSMALFSVRTLGPILLVRRVIAANLLASRSSATFYRIPKINHAPLSLKS